MTAEFGRAIASRIFATASALICGVVSLRVYSHYLSPETYGVILVALQLLNYLPLLDGGFRTTTNRAILSGEDEVARVKIVHFGQIFYSYIGLIAVLGGTLLMAFYACSPIAQRSGQPLAFFMAIGTSAGLAFMSNTQMGLLIGFNRQIHVFLLTGISALLNTMVLWLLLRGGMGSWAFPLSASVSSLATFLIACGLVKQAVPQLRVFNFRLDADFWKSFQAMKGDAWACFRSQISIMLLFTLDVILVGFLCGAKDAAVYGVLARLFGIIRNFLQAASEVSWPYFARNNAPRTSLGGILLNLNAWMYGGVLGALSLTLLPFLKWFMGADWTATAGVLYFVVFRFLVTGIYSAAAFILMGLGRFQTIARYVQFELATSSVLAGVLGWLVGLQGIAAGFAIATLTGAFFPIFVAYAKIEGIPPYKILLQVGWRAVVSFSVAIGVSAALTHWKLKGLEFVAVGGGAAAAAFMVAGAIALMRMKFSVACTLQSVAFRNVLKKI